LKGQVKNEEKEAKYTKKYYVALGFAVFLGISFLVVSVILYLCFVKKTGR